MRLSTVVELLLILLLVAFAAYGRVIDHEEGTGRLTEAAKQSGVDLSTMTLKQASDTVNRYCTCNENICNCCRDFHIPLVQLKGPGCASLQYLQGDNLAVQLSFGDNILTSSVVSGKSPKPVCVPLPGGFTKFCGRIYSIQRDTKDHFKACLGLELQSSTELEASLRVSCFRFGPDGLKLRPAEPLPVVEAEASDEDEEDDIFDFGFGGGSDDDDDDDDDDDYEEDAPSPNSVSNSSTNSDDADDDEEDDDILGLGALLDILTGEEETTTKKPKVTTAAPLLQFTIPILTKPTSSSPLDEQDAALSSVSDLTAEAGTSEDALGNEENSQELEIAEENADVSDATDESVLATEPTATANEEDDEEQAVESSNKVANYAKPAKNSTEKPKETEVKKKKPSVTSTSINAIEDETKKKKPASKPPKKDDDYEEYDDDDDDDDDDNIDLVLADDDDEDEDDDDDDDLVGDSNHDDNDDEEKGKKKHKVHNEDEDGLDDLDDDEEEEDAMISALVYGEKDEEKKSKVTKNGASSDEDDESDYGLDGLLARKRHLINGRQSRVMRL